MDNLHSTFNVRAKQGFLDRPQVSNKQVWAIAGGKGGVGKTFISSNFAITLARANAKVIAIDLDLGGANLHTSLGANIRDCTLSDFLEDSNTKLEDLAVPTCVPNMFLISGAQDSINIANLSISQKKKLTESIRNLDANYIILDLGAGTSYNTLDFFLAADIGLLSILPEPTSVENSYRFIKAVYYRKLKYLEHKYDVEEYFQALTNRNNELGIRSPAEMLRYIESENRELAEVVRAELNTLELKFVLNQVRTEADCEMGYGIKNVCKKYFDLNVDFLGSLEHDSAVWQAVRKRKPLAIEFPSNPLMPKMQRMVGRLVAEHAEKLRKSRLHDG